MLTTLDPLLIALALIVMGTGLVRHRPWRRLGRNEQRPGAWTGLLPYLLGHRRILRRPGAGLAHLALFWGLLVPLLLVLLAQFALVLSPLPARCLSLLTDLLGLALFLGLLFFLQRRLRSEDRDRPAGVMGPMGLLLLIVATGFLAAGARLSILAPGPSWDSPVGGMLAAVLPASPLLMQAMIRLHFLAVLSLLATLPYTFMRHGIAASLNVYYRKQGPRGQQRPICLEQDPLGAATLADLSWKQLLDAEACVDCGRCEEACPAHITAKPLSPRKVLREIRGQMEAASRQIAGPETGRLPLLEEAVTPQEIWACTSCMACVERCPVFADPLDKILDMRRHQTLGRGLLPAEARPVIRNLTIFGDVHGKGAALRTDWALNRDVPRFSTPKAQPEILLWPGCYGAFHPRYTDTTRAMVRILKAGRVAFGILGKEERCCGEPARKLGEEALFMDLARENIRILQERQVRRIVTLCPHCLHTLKNDYPLLGGDFEVLHAAQLVADLIRQERIRLMYPLEARVAVHDPCYLGRGNGVYEPLRDVLRPIPRLELRELERNRAEAFCCGGGGGRMWLHEDLGRRINRVRAEEVAAGGAGLVATGCPYCLAMLEDGISALEAKDPPRVKDVIEIVAASLAEA